MRLRNRHRGGRVGLSRAGELGKSRSVGRRLPVASTTCCGPICHGWGPVCHPERVEPRQLDGQGVRGSPRTPRPGRSGCSTPPRRRRTGEGTPCTPRPASSPCARSRRCTGAPITRAASRPRGRLAPARTRTHRPVTAGVPTAVGLVPMVRLSLIQIGRHVRAGDHVVSRRAATRAGHDRLSAG